MDDSQSVTTMSTRELKQIIVGLQNMNDRLGSVLEVLTKSDEYIENFIDTQIALNQSILPFRAAFEVKRPSPTLFNAMHKADDSTR